MQFNSVNKKIVSVFVLLLTIFPFHGLVLISLHLPQNSTPMLEMLGVIYAQCWSGYREDSCRSWITKRLYPSWSEERNSDRRQQLPWAGVRHTCEVQSDPSGVSQGGEVGRKALSWKDLHRDVRRRVWDNKKDRGHAWTKETYQKTRGEAGRGERGGLCPSEEQYPSSLLKLCHTKGLTSGS